MTTLSPQQIADLKAKIAARYCVDQFDDGSWAVFKIRTIDVASAREHADPLDAEAEMEAIIQDEVKAAMEEMDGSAT